MNIPTNCPICGDPLTNIFNESTDKVLYKNCRLRPDHIFSCAVYMFGFMGAEGDTLERVTFTLSMSPMLSVEVYLRDKVMYIDKSPPRDNACINNNTKRLPFYVEPDFSNYTKLVNKIKTYLLFS